jgi:hypothetical protein
LAKGRVAAGNSLRFAVDGVQGDSMPVAFVFFMPMSERQSGDTSQASSPSWTSHIPSSRCVTGDCQG